MGRLHTLARVGFVLLGRMEGITAYTNYLLGINEMTDRKSVV